MPSKINPGLLKVGSGKSSQDSVSVSSLDFANIIDFQAALDGHINDPSDAHSANSISILDTYEKYDSTQVEGSLTEISDLLPITPNVLGSNVSGIPNSGVPSWGAMDASVSGAFTCNTADHGHHSWLDLGSTNQGSSPENWMAESSSLIPSTITTFSVSGILYPADRGVLCLLYSPTGEFNNSDEEIVAMLNLSAHFDETRRRNPAVGYKQLDYTPAGTGVDLFTLTNRLPMLKEYSSAPYTPFEYNYLAYQLATFSTNTFDLTSLLGSYNISLTVDFGSLRLVHFKTFTNVLTANYSQSNIYGESNKYDIYSDVVNAAPVGTGTYTVEPIYPLGTETATGAAAGAAGGTNTLTASGFTSGDVGKLITVSGNGNDGDYQILQYIDAATVKVIPDWLGSNGAVSIAWVSPIIKKTVGVSSYNSGNAFKFGISEPDVFNYTYGTKSSVDSDVTIPSIVEPIVVGLDEFGAIDLPIPYYELDNFDLENSPDGYNREKGNAPSSSDAGIVNGVFISGDDAQNVDAEINLHLYKPVGGETVVGVGATGRTILVNTYDDSLIGKSQIEDFTSSIMHYSMDSADVWPDIYNFDFLRCSVTPKSHALGGLSVLNLPGDVPGSNTLSAPNIFTVGGASWFTEEADLGRILHIAGSSNNDGDYYISQIVSGNIINVIPDFPSPTSDSDVLAHIAGKRGDSLTLVGANGDKHAAVYGGRLQYPYLDLSTTAYPSGNDDLASNPYSTDAADTIRYFQRAFDTEAPVNMGKLKITMPVGSDLWAAIAADVFTGDLAIDHSGGAVVLIKVPGISGWLDLGRYNGDPDLNKENDYYGCLITQEVISSNQIIFTYATDFYTQNNGGDEYPLAIRVGLVKNGTGEFLSFEEIEWIAY